MARKQTALLAGVLVLLLFGLLLCACGGSPAPGYSVPDYPYKPADIEGMSLPLRRVQVTNGRPTLTEAVGTITVKNGLFHADVEDKNWALEDMGEEQTLTDHCFSDAALSVAQFSEEGYSLSHFLFYHQSYYLVAEKNGADFVLSCNGRTDDMNYSCYGYLFDEPMPTDKFFDLIKQYWAQYDAESQSGGYGLPY